MSRQAVQAAFHSLLRRARSLGLACKPVRLAWGRRTSFPAARDHGFTDGRTVTVAPRLASANARRLLGVLAHELGHCALLQAGYDQHAETDADVVAARILGVSLGYDQQDVQAAGLRRRRPRRLPP